MMMFQSYTSLASYFPAQKAVFDGRATKLGARTRRQVAADKL